MKKCSKCLEEKSANSFPWKRKQDNTRGVFCNICMSELARLHYRNNKKQYLIRNEIHRDKIQALVQSRKTKPCADCGNTYPPECMDFDHVRGRKKFNLGKAANVGSIRLALLEIEKCEVVCSNCHRIRTRNRSVSQRQRRTA